MGITLYSKGSKLSFDMGYGGFHNLRCNIADCIDAKFGEVYRDYTLCVQSPQLWAEKLNTIIEKKNLNCDLALDFLFESDCSGEADYKTCREILEIIKDVDFGDKYFRYGAIAHNDYEEFKAFLGDCVRYHRKMKWD